MTILYSGGRRDGRGLDIEDRPFPFFDTLHFSDGHSETHVFDGTVNEAGWAVGRLSDHLIGMSRNEIENILEREGKDCVDLETEPVCSTSLVEGATIPPMFQGIIHHK